ncbi:hypothetical protein FIBSPDRAFT_850850 [Athelia psychrophila]|uniref:Uncharacterized protein n=1 Tax=Athelia psychrophila TaxID=1759441 RepID=A0A166T336_9AGAM|nr:hypothetical protein FIBSPDRAFT_850850 [Fibularhizoctonia sp. CBS 109695]
MPSLLRLLRVVAWAFVGVVALIAVFVILPSPAVLESTLENNIRDGLPVMRAYKVEQFMPHSIFTSDARRPLKDAFAIKWTYDENNNTLLVNDIPHFRLHPEYNNSHMQDEPVMGQPTTVPVFVGNLDGINLPWLNLADATLMLRDIMPIHGPEYATFKLRVAGAMRHRKDGALIYEMFVAPPPAASAHHLPALLTLTYEPGILGPTFQFPQTPFSASPSITFPIRRAIVYILAPVVFTVIPALMIAGYAVRIAFWVTVGWLLWAIAFGSLKNQRRQLMGGAPSAVPAVASDAQAEGKADREQPEPGKTSGVAGAADNMV